MKPKLIGIIFSALFATLAIANQAQAVHCGSANHQYFDNKSQLENAELCKYNPNDASSVTGNGPWYWTCSRSGYTTKYCEAYKNSNPVNGQCGSSNGSAFYSKPNNNLCSIGSSSSVSGSGPWNWSCYGSDGGNNASCSAIKKVTGVCGNSNGGSFYSKPNSNLCSAGNSSSVSGNGPWNWTCSGINGGGTASCGASKKENPINGQCGSANGNNFYSKPTNGLCSAGNSSSVSGNGPWNWTCSGSNGGSNASCSAGEKKDGSCGSSNGQILNSKPTSNLCSTGDSSSVSGNGPWNWTCSGSNGGSNASCSAGTAVCGNGTKELDEQCDDGNNTNGDGCSASCQIEAAAIKIDKNDNDNSDDTQTVRQGENATFKITVTNSSQISLTDVIITDTKAPSCAKTAVETKALYEGDTFDAGESFTYTCTDIVNNSYANTAAVSGMPVNGGNDVTDNDNSQVEVIMPSCGDGIIDTGEQCDDGNNTNGDGCSASCQIEAAAIKIDKNDNDNSDDTQTVRQGENATFKITVTNSSQISLTDVIITDTKAPSCAKSATETINLYEGDTFDAGESFTYTCSNSNTTSAYTNIATVTANPTNGSSSVTDNDNSKVEIIIPGCGDGTVNTGEQCDDGNTNSGDGCSASCQIEVAPESTPEPAPEPKKKGKCKGSIGNYIWYDADDDGKQDKNEKGIEDVRVKLKYAGKDGKWGNKDDEVFRTDTNHNGHYIFENLCAGNYKLYVKENDIKGLKQTYDPDGKKDNKTKISLGKNDSHTKADFGYVGKRKIVPATGVGEVAVFLLVIFAAVGAIVSYKQFRRV